MSPGTLLCFLLPPAKIYPWGEERRKEFMKLKYRLCMRDIWVHSPALQGPPSTTGITHPWGTSMCAPDKPKLIKIFRINRLVGKYYLNWVCISMLGNHVQHIVINWLLTDGYSCELSLHPLPLYSFAWHATPGVSIIDVEEISIIWRVINWPLPFCMPGIPCLFSNSYMLTEGKNTLRGGFSSCTIPAWKLGGATSCLALPSNSWRHSHHTPCSAPVD